MKGHRFGMPESSLNLELEKTIGLGRRSCLYFESGPFSPVVPTVPMVSL